MEMMISGVKGTGCLYRECQSRREKTRKSIHASAAVARLDIFCLRGALYQILKRQCFQINYRAGPFGILTPHSISHSELGKYPAWPKAALSRIQFDHLWHLVRQHLLNKLMRYRTNSRPSRAASIFISTSARVDAGRVRPRPRVFSSTPKRFSIEFKSRLCGGHSESENDS